MLKLGVDNGNYNTKSSERLLYMSGFIESDAPSIDTERQLQYNGKYYAIGTGRMHVQNDKTQDDGAFLLTLPAIAEAMKRLNVQSQGIVLGVGLPIGVYGAQHAAFRDYFIRRNIAFTYGEDEYACDIVECKVFPQGYAALCKNYRLLDSYTDLTIADIGGYTVDVLSVRNKKPDKSSCISLPLGTITLFNRIKDALMQHSIRLTDEQVASAIRGSLQHIQSKRIIDIAKDHVHTYVRELHNALRERGIDLQFPMVFAGGGAELLSNVLQTSDIYTVAILDRFSNAEGYRFLLEES